jgi:benzoyl-CoA reductase/2-hydroxyglutaryl-CoA dehydratase subunit BcrC/BadD/HgdB
MERYVEHLLAMTEVDGIVCHILKGQIEYDFMLSRLEPLFEQHDVPVFRLETDYQYQDVEQLRIRLEAFAEMLGQRMLVSDRMNARRYCA